MKDEPVYNKETKGYEYTTLIHWLTVLTVYMHTEYSGNNYWRDTKHENRE